MKPQILEYKGYQGSIEASIEDNVLHGKILHINDLVTYESETPAGLMDAFEAQVDDYLEFCREEGVEPDKPYKGSFNVRVGSSIHKRLVLAATREGMSLNETVAKVLANWLDDCTDGFSVTHLHKHEHRLVTSSSTDGHKFFRGSIELENFGWTPEVKIPTSVSIQ